MDKKPAPFRVRALDWHRGLAVLVMIECHCLVLLHPSLDNHPLRLWLNGINGLVAPSFIFAAGFSLAMVMARAAVDPAGRRERAFKSLVRICEVLAVANLLKWQLWPVRQDPSWWLRVDILSCIGYSLLVLWAFVFAGGNRPRGIAAAMGALGILVFAASPWTETVTGGGPLRHFVNNRTNSPFPFLPWAGYAFLGASLGGLMSIPEKGLTLTVRGLVAMFALGTAIAWGGPVLSKIYPWDVWFLTNAGERIWRVAAIALVLVGVEQFGARKGFAMRNPLTWLLEFYGTQSLSVFYFHIILLCGWSFTVPFDGFLWIRTVGNLHHKCGWAGFWGLTVAIIAATGLLVRAWDVVDTRLPWKKKKAKPKPAA